MSETDRMEIAAELVQRMGDNSAYEVTGTVTTVVYAANAGEAIAMVLAAMKEQGYVRT